MAMKELSDALFFVCSLEFLRMSVLWTYSLISSYWQLIKESEIVKSYPRCSPSTSPFRPVCVITGATSGLGAASALALSKEGYFVVIVGRSHQLLEETIKRIKDCNEDAQVKAFQVDMSSIKSIVTFTKSFQHWLLESDLHCSVQILVNNAGILATSHKVTADGYDQMIGTNYIGAFALTKLLLPLLESSPVTSRIVNVTSFTHRSVNDIQVDERTVSGRRFLSSEQYPCAQIYEYSKLCLLLFSYELHRQLSSVGKSWHVSVTAADPGAVQTNIMREVPSIISSLAFKVLGLLGLLQTPNTGLALLLMPPLHLPKHQERTFLGEKAGLPALQNFHETPN